MRHAAGWLQISAGFPIDRYTITVHARTISPSEQLNNNIERYEVLLCTNEATIVF